MKKTEFESLYESYLEGRTIDGEVMIRAMAEAVYEMLKGQKHEKKDKHVRRVRKSNSVSRKRSSP